MGEAAACHSPGCSVRGDNGNGCSVAFLPLTLLHVYQTQLRLPQCLCLALSCGEVGVEALHEFAGAGVVYQPERCGDGFDALGEEVVAEAGDFDAFFVDAAFGRFAGREHGEVDAAKVGHGLDFGYFEPFAVTEE